MIKSTHEMIVRARRVLKNMLERCIELNSQPSYFEMYHSGYLDGIADSENGITIDTAWHYIELEGLPPTDDRCLCLIQADRYQDTEIGWYDKDNNKWHCNYWNESYNKVVAWHMLPTVEQAVVAKKPEPKPQSKPLDFSEIKKLKNGTRIVNILKNGKWSERFSFDWTDNSGMKRYSVLTEDDLMKVDEVEFLKQRDAGKLSWNSLKEYRRTLGERRFYGNL